MRKHCWKATVPGFQPNEQTLYISDLSKLLVVVKWDQYATLLSEIE